MKKSAALFGVLLCLFFFQSQAQFGYELNKFKNRLADKVIQKSSDKVIDKTADKASESVGNSMDKVLNNSTSNGSSKSSNNSTSNSTDKNSGMESIFKKLNSGQEPSEKYEFSASYTMKMTMNSKSNKSMTSEMIYHLNPKANYFGMEMGISAQNQNMKATTIIDLDKKSIYTLIGENDKKMRMSMTMPDDETKSNYEAMTITKTNETKTILGYVCESYNTTSNEANLKLWVSRNSIKELAELNSKMASFTARNKNGLDNSYLKNPEIVKIINEGRAVLGMDMVDKKGNEMHSEIIKISKSDNWVVNMSEYPSMMAK